MSPDRPVRVLFLGHGAERTGPPILLGQFLEWLGANTDATVEVVVARDGPLADWYRESGAAVRAVSRLGEPAEPMLAGLRRLGRPHQAEQARDHLTRRRMRDLARPDLVVVNSISPPTLNLLRSLPDGHGPVVAWVHELDIALDHGLSAEEQRVLRLQPDHYVAVSQAVADNLAGHHGIDPGRIHVHHGWVDVAAIQQAATGPGAVRHGRLGLAPDAFVVGAIGLPDWRKAPEHLLHVAWLVRRQRPDINLHLLWVGGSPADPQRWQLPDEATRLGLADRWHLHPHEDEPARWLGIVDVFALPAREDAFPLACLEAGAAGCPIVAFASGGAPELVGTDAGVIVPYPDLEAFAQALIDLHDDPDRRRRLGEAARARVTEQHDQAAAAPLLWADLASWTRSSG